MSGRPKLVNIPPLHPLPDAPLIDQSVLGGIGSSTPQWRHFINYLQSNNEQLYVSTGVIEELSKGWGRPLRRQRLA
jgi:hypothetical protein